MDATTPRRLPIGLGPAHVTSGPGPRGDAPDLAAIRAWLDGLDAGALDPEVARRLREALAVATVEAATGQRLIRAGDRLLGRIHRYGSVALYLPTEPPGGVRRVLELDRAGQLLQVIRRGRDGGLVRARVLCPDGDTLEIQPRAADHPLWGVSDRIVSLDDPADPETLTVCGAVVWDAIAALPPLADPTRLPPGAGTAVLNLLAGLAADQEAGPLRYRGPYPTEQLFWALTESFRFDPAVPDPLGVFIRGAEDRFLTGESHEVPLDWRAAPHERRLLPQGIWVQLRDGVEKACWQGWTYSRPDVSALARREHRVIRAVRLPDGRPGFAARLEALGQVLDEPLVFDAEGELLECRPDADQRGPAGDTPLAPPWRDALAVLLPLEATPLLAGAIAAAWPALGVVWGAVPGDLVETRGGTVRLSTRLAGVYLAERSALGAETPRPLAQRLVREVLGLLGPPVRRAAAAWLESEPASRREAHLEAAARADRHVLLLRGAERLGPLLAALEAGQALPASPGPH